MANLIKTVRSVGNDEAFRRQGAVTFPAKILSSPQMDRQAETPQCARCGVVLPPSSPGGWCPRCALAQALEPGAESGGPLDLRDIPLPQKLPSLRDYELLEVIAHGGI